MVVRPCQFDDVDPGLLEAYADESGIEGMPRPKAQADIYRRLEMSGLLHIAGAYEGEQMIGLISMIVNVLPHYGIVAGVVESFFVAQDKRKTGAGLELLRWVRETARGIGAQAILVTAPSGGQLDRVLPLAGYRETNKVYFRSLTCNS